MYYSPFGPLRLRSNSCRENTGCARALNRSGPQAVKNDPVNTGQHSEHSIVKKEACLPYFFENTTMQELFFKHSSMGEVIVPQNTEIGKSLRIASLNIDTSKYRNFAVHLNFSCNVITSDACLYLEFQIFRQLMKQITPVPVSPAIHYARTTRSTESNSLSFFCVDEDEIGSKCCNYGVYAKIIGYDTIGVTRVTNPVIVCILDCNKK